MKFLFNRFFFIGLVLLPAMSFAADPGAGPLPDADPGAGPLGLMILCSCIK